MLKKLKACCGCGKNDVIVPEHNAVSKSPAFSETDEYVIRPRPHHGSNFSKNPIRSETSYQTTPPLEYKNSDADSGTSEVRTV